MKKFLGVSLVAVLAVSPMMAQADVATVGTSDTVVGVASTKYVKEAYNAMAGAVNSELGTINTAIGNKQDKISDLATIRSGAAKGATSVQSVTAATDQMANGTISVDGTAVAVKGLGSAAYANTSAFDASGAAAAVETKLSAGSTGYNIDAQSLKVKGTSVLTSGSSLSGSKITAGTVKKTALVTDVQTSLDKADTALQSNSALNGANLTAGTVAKTALATDVQTSLGKADSAVQSVTAATDQMANGTISVDGTAVAVKGLGSAAYTASTAYATAAQGTKADNAADKNLSNLSDTGQGVITTNVTTNAAKGTFSASTTYSDGTIGAAIKGKQDKISDLTTIRSGAAKGATALQSDSALNGANLTAGSVAAAALATDAKALFDAAGAATTAAGAVETKLTTGASGYDIDAKTLKVQGTSVLTTSSSLNGAKLTSATVKKTALATDVQTSLGKADTALQSNSALNGANLTTGTVSTAALADGAVTAAKLGAEIQLYSGWNSGGTPTANATTVALVAPAHGS